jgi:hypothetical protein
MELASVAARQERAKASAAERAESDRYWKENLPGPDQLESLIRSGSVQVFLEGERAYFTLSTSTSTDNGDGSVSSSSTSSSFPLVLEEGRWRVGK